MEVAFNKSLENLNLEYIDLYLMHFPNAYQRVLKHPSLDPDDADSYELTPRDEQGKKPYTFRIFLSSGPSNLM